MIFQPAIIALLLASGVGLALIMATVPFAVRVLRHWDLASGAESQLALERRTYLSATLLAFVCATQIVATLLFVFNADRMATMFVGAMCAVGTLNVNAFGFPALIAQLVLLFLCAGWLIVHHADNQGYDYPLIRPKYGALLLLAPVAATAFGLQLAYFLGLRADVITSCCGSLFGSDAQTLAAELAAVPPDVMMPLFFGMLAVAVGASGYHALQGWRVRAQRVSATLVTTMSLVALGVTLAGIVSFVSLHIYEHPHHHCPFCVLKPEYGYQGYALYVPLFAATAAGFGTGLVQPAARHRSLATAAPRIARRLAAFACLGFSIVTLAAAAMIVHSNLVLLHD
jgi:hypothetical protein